MQELFRVTSLQHLLNIYWFFWHRNNWIAAFDWALPINYIILLVKKVEIFEMLRFVHLEFWKWRIFLRWFNKLLFVQSFGESVRHLACILVNFLITCLFKTQVLIFINIFKVYFWNYNFFRLILLDKIFNLQNFDVIFRDMQAAFVVHD